MINRADWPPSALNHLHCLPLSKTINLQLLSLKCYRAVAQFCLCVCYTLCLRQVLEITICSQAAWLANMALLASCAALLYFWQEPGWVVTSLSNWLHLRGGRGHRHKRAALSGCALFILAATASPHGIQLVVVWFRCTTSANLIHPHSSMHVLNHFHSPSSHFIQSLIHKVGLWTCCLWTTAWAKFVTYGNNIFCKILIKWEAEMYEGPQGV